MRFSPVLLFHICTASIGLLSGTVAMVLRKGSRQHSVAGDIFVIAMLSMSASGAYIAFIKHQFIQAGSQMLNIFVGVLTFYLVATGWLTARRRVAATGIFDWGGLLVALAVGAALVTYGLQAANSRTGLADGYPAAPYFTFGSVALLSAVGDVRMLLRRGVSGAPRIARHLWRMCFAFLIAVLSFFLGKQEVFPASLRGSKIFFLPPLLVLISMLFWLARLLLTNAFKKTPSRSRMHKGPNGLTHELLPASAKV